jgi:uncharacterized protein (TIGR02996 family)
VAHSTSPDLAHPDWLALYSAVLAAPHKDPPRRAAAAWLRANGDPDRASFILAQLRVAKYEQRHARRIEGQARATPDGGGGGPKPRSQAQSDLDTEAYATQGRLSNLVGLWYPPGTHGMGLVDLLPKGSAGVCGVLERGFVGWVVVSRLERWWEVGADVCRHHPVCLVTVRYDLNGRQFRTNDDLVRKERERVLGETALNWARWSAARSG